MRSSRSHVSFAHVSFDGTRAARRRKRDQTEELTKRDIHPLVRDPLVRRYVMIYITITALFFSAQFMAAQPAVARETAKNIAIRAADPASGPLLTVVSLRRQKLRIFDLNGEVTASRVSSGKPGFDTPTGVFSLLEKNVYHQSNIYAGAEMPFMQRLTWSGIALHAGQVPGYRASHGCIRLPYSFARSLFDITKLGGRVVVTQDETAPIAFSHPKLFKPLPQTAPFNEMAAVRTAPQINTRVASNDIAIGINSADSSLELPRLFGITPALAEAVKSHTAAPARPRSRTDVALAMREKLSHAETELKVIEAQRRSATDAAKAAVQASSAANLKLASLRKDGERARTALRDAETKLALVEKSFDTFLRAVPAATGTPADAKLEDRETDLEDELLMSATGVDAARVVVARNELALAEVQADAITADTARARALASVQKAVVDLKSAQLALVDVKKDMVRRGKPISVLISLKASRIYVRQGFEPVLEAPITLSRPIDRIGTHVMTAMRFDPQNPDIFEWRLITAQMPPQRRDGETEETRKRQRNATPEPMQPSFATAVAEEALDAVSIPQDIIDTITERAAPGASLIITDRDLKANENGLNTEFVLLTR